MTEAALPLAACRAVGGDPKKAVHVTAALLTFAASLRIYDDVADRYRPGQLWEETSPAQAMNYAFGLHTISFGILNNMRVPDEQFRRIHQQFVNAGFILASGQDRDLAGATKTIETTCVTIETKAGCPYALACSVGAMVGTNIPERIQGCHSFGHHLGITVQILNDFESIWQPSGKTDLTQGKVTLPLIYGMSCEHPHRDALIEWAQTGQISANAQQIKQILDGIDTKDFMLWAALKEREEAIDALAVCTVSSGVDALTSYITGLFGDMDILRNSP